MENGGTGSTNTTASYVQNDGTVQDTRRNKMNLTERYLMSGKTMSIDLDKFISGEYPKLIIAGLSGGGKSTLCRNLASKHKATCYESDLCEDFLPALSASSEVFPKAILKRLFKSCIIPKLKTNKREILEGGLVWQNYWLFPEHRKLMAKIPTIVLGTSALESTLRLIQRRKSVGKSAYDPKSLYRVYRRNFKYLEKALQEFKNLRMKEGGSIEVFKLPPFKESITMSVSDKLAEVYNK